VESFAPAAGADTFSVAPVPTRVTAPPPTTRADPPATAAPSPAPSAAPPSAASDPAGAVQSWQPQTVARLRRAVAVYATPGDRTAVGALAATTEFGNPRILPVVQLGGDWLRVQLPTRPNGSEGWIRARDAALDQVDDEVDVDLAARTLTWSRAGVVQLQVSAAVGAPASPTPVGRFFVTDVLPETPGGSYGAWVVALDAHSDAFTEFEGGDARIAIHGTDAPSSIGAGVSAGCVRLADAPLAQLAAALVAGTPVVVH
jgi:lipoprotein-anchoring transpeptidase ErfK/SrfK